MSQNIAAEYIRSAISEHYKSAPNANSVSKNYPAKFQTLTTDNDDKHKTKSFKKSDDPTAFHIL